MVVRLRHEMKKTMMRIFLLLSSLAVSTACVPTTDQYTQGLNSVSNVVESSITSGRKAIEGALVKPKKKRQVEEVIEDAGNASISDEQDFEAVSNRETIESDAERRRRQSEKYVLVKPEELPARPKVRYLTPIQFAVSTKHPIGKRMYNRLNVSLGNVTKPCTRYQSDELAQFVFLKSGGPTFDSRGVDPDGDGYACGWDPSVYRNLKKK